MNLKIRNEIYRLLMNEGETSLTTVIRDVNTILKKEKVYPMDRESLIKVVKKMIESKEIILIDNHSIKLNKGKS